MLTLSEKGFPLLLHGYDRALSDVITTVNEPRQIRIGIEVCDLDRLCSYESVSVRLVPSRIERNLTSAFIAATKSHNLQQLLQLLVFNGEHDVIEALVSDHNDIVMTSYDFMNNHLG